MYVYIYIERERNIILHIVSPNSRPTAILMPSKNTLLRGEEDPWINQLGKHQIRGWRAVSAAGLHGQGSPERSVLFTGTSSADMS